MPHSVHFSDQADVHLRELGIYIADRKSARVAVQYITDLVNTCYSLATMPHRGSRHDQIQTGLRTIGFRRRVVIAFHVSDSSVQILAVLYGGQDLEAYFHAHPFH